MNKIKTCIRYPGGKSKGIKFLCRYFPADFTEFREPFAGGGSVFIYLMQTNPSADYHINDLFFPVYCFWKILHEQPMTMMNYILQRKDEYVLNRHEIITKGIASTNAENGRRLHALCRSEILKYIENRDEFHTACFWYILNKTSFSGMSMIGSYAKLSWDQNFTDRCILNLPNVASVMHSVKSLKITNLDYSELLKDTNSDTFIFMDPPYDIKDNLYGNNGDMHRGFNHMEFADKVKGCKTPWMITYNDNETLRSWFSEYQCIPWDLQYTMKSAKREGQENSSKSGKSGKKGKELLIMNYAQGKM